MRARTIYDHHCRGGALFSLSLSRPLLVHLEATASVNVQNCVRRELVVEYSALWKGKESLEELNYSFGREEEGGVASCKTRKRRKEGNKIFYDLRRKGRKALKIVTPFRKDVESRSASVFGRSFLCVLLVQLISPSFLRKACAIVGLSSLAPFMDVLSFLFLLFRLSSVNTDRSNLCCALEGSAELIDSSSIMHQGRERRCRIDEEGGSQGLQLYGWRGGGRLSCTGQLRKYIRI